MSSRAALASPIPVNTTYDRPSSSDRRKNMPSAVVPPRTSSQQVPGNPGGASTSSRKQQQSADRSASQRYGGADVNGQAGASHVYQEDGSRSRRSEKPSSSQREPARTNAPPVAMPIRTQHSASSTPQGPSREASEILNTMLVSQPEVDIERERERAALSHRHPSEALDDAVAAATAGEQQGEESRRGTRSRHDYSKREKHTKFGEYILGNTIGEGEFGKVKLGWKQEGGVQVAIKLIKKDQLGSNPSRMAKIMREVHILKQLTHPNIVRLHKMEESERHYGIVLEYASGGELFDYILNHRYLKDNAARRLFAQLVSGVGYLHKKGIVHRDLKLENLLLDRNRNIIITDFGFANTFDPTEELSEEEENNLSDREFVKRMGLNQVKPNGLRKGDLMQTSCGSPCYAAPELVVSDSLYTGRKVDVWSCGVILYAMLAGYLPFDDDPANPEGDNINLLYKYIVNTPLTFPEYVTPHARDLLRRILVPNPRKRADLFEVARHSWLSEYAHVVEFITSSTTTPGEIQNTTVGEEDDRPMMGRSASVREAHRKAAPAPAIGGLASKQGTVDPEAEAAAHAKQQRDNKRRTVQVEYVAPNTQTQRGETASSAQGGSSMKTKARSSSQGPVEVQPEKPLPRDPPAGPQYPPVSSRKPPSSHMNNNQNVAPSRTSRESTRAASDGSWMSSGMGASGRPMTGGSANSMGLGSGRSQYGQPSAPMVADTNVHGRIQQPPGRSNHEHSGHAHTQSTDFGRLSANTHNKPGSNSGYSDAGSDTKGHRRSNTIGEIGGKIFGRSGSLFGNRNRKSQQIRPEEKRYPPVSMTKPIADDAVGRPSMDSKPSRRSFSLGLGGKKRSGSMTGSSTSLDKQSKRFSLLPNSFSLKAIGLGKDDGYDQRGSQPSLAAQDPPQVDEHGRYFEQPHAPDATDIDGMYAQLQHPQGPAPTSAPGQAQQYQQHQYGPANTHLDQRQQDARQNQAQARMMHQQQQGAAPNSASGSSAEHIQRPTNQSAYSLDQSDSRRTPSRGGRGVLSKNKRFVDAYDTDEYSQTQRHGPAGSSGAARRVMDFFRRRGKARGGEDR
ncbi:kinase-like protein [Cryphonectria parasitica EP155]|uniref:non-specific serine/threonine protein kinase n=1 Tax=Cryphonectria parasitica (strain ATCC 38755 / EP155) TaxID=660469 RepID=A0A9P5CNQ1_CRYP1|nr:kinase-like protein [Cryphonectria parasitica EP155]KAF3764567.1 kinase-like protein [Cryphonectria parasitica EP155]